MSPILSKGPSQIATRGQRKRSHRVAPHRWVGVLLLGLISIVVVRITMSDMFVDLGDQVRELEGRRATLVEENDDLRNQLASSCSYASIARRAQQELGLAYSPEAIDYVTPPVMAAR